MLVVVVVSMGLLGVPLSWPKLRVNHAVQFVGLVVDLEACTLGLSEDKVSVLLGFLRSIRKGTRLDRRGLEKGVGGLQWVSVIAPTLRPWLAEFYRLINKPGLMWRQLAVEEWDQVADAMGEDGVLLWDVGGFTRGMSLSFVGKHKARSKRDWRQWAVGVGSVAFSDWTSRKVRVSASAEAAVLRWIGWLTRGGSIRSLIRRWVVPGEAAADAFAAGDWASMGGWWMEVGELKKWECRWFRLEVNRDDLRPWVDIKGRMQDDIAFFECLAQVTLLALRTQEGRFRSGLVRQGCDNQTTMGALRKWMSMCDPLTTAAQAMSGWENENQVEARRLLFIFASTPCFFLAYCRYTPII